VGGRAAAVAAVFTRQTGRSFLTTRRWATTTPSSLVEPSSTFSTESALLSIPDCLKLYQAQQQQQQHQTQEYPNGGGRLCFVDASWYHRGERNGRSEFLSGPRMSTGDTNHHCCVYFDLADVSSSTITGSASAKAVVDADSDANESSRPPNSGVVVRRPSWGMLPTPALFGAAMDAMAIRPDDHVVVYGRAGSLFTPRVWLTFYALGHGATTKGRLSLLQGSLEDWEAAGGPVDTTELPPSAIPRAVDLNLLNSSSNGSGGVYQARPIPSGMVATLQDDIRDVVLSNDGGNNDATSAVSTTTFLLDARGSSFALKGHMPGAIHLPYSHLMVDKEANSCRLLPREELQRVLSAALGIATGKDDGENEEAGSTRLAEYFTADTDQDANATTRKRIICTCGSGISACTLYVALRECGVPETALSMYDGSWGEYKLYDDLPKVF
jgi:thiosulfate/3-mercaptopyruvate sulfurtransferase